MKRGGSATGLLLRVRFGLAARLSLISAAALVWVTVFHGDWRESRWYMLGIAYTVS